MTYILGWKNYTSVFLVGDSVITIEHPNVDGNKNTFRNQTSFGEDHIYEDGKTVSEKWLKLYDLKGKIIIAISGNVRDAYEGIESLNKAIASQAKFDLRQEIKYSFFGKEAGIIIGFIENEEPVLISCHCNGYPSFIEHSPYEVVHSGTIHQRFKDQTQSAFSQFTKNDWNDDQILASIIAVAQSFCFQEDIISQGVGGFFSGIRMDRTGVAWQPDLVFFPFSYNGMELQNNQVSEIFGAIRPVMTQVRDSILYSCSSAIKDVKKFKRPFANFQPEEIIKSEGWIDARLKWAAKWGRELNENWEECKADYYIFYNTDKPIVALVYSNEKKPFVVNDNSFGSTKEDFYFLLTILSSKADEELTLYTEF
ncbi:hypothetical protein GYM62_14870 [Algoriphagus sp. NBT04N3]|uniref:hypothetical protein n=1 Tax=Algoriphagus sp. NBT04N3 TaxID=2705473 RepID=UPI001C629CD5|nr:hypothetical protein [Algoriphagus sp. NBT04N3]QYH40007.1 hypothetical protein GYM62_14870 [Algoriphagus sp. NBT04N3]